MLNNNFAKFVGASLAVLALFVALAAAGVLAVGYVAQRQVDKLDRQASQAIETKLQRLDGWVDGKIAQVERLRIFRDEARGDEPEPQLVTVAGDVYPTGYSPPPPDVAAAVLESLGEDGKSLSERAPELLEAVAAEQLAPPPARGPPAGPAAGPAAPQDEEQDAVLLYRYLRRAYAERNGGETWQPGSQGIGDCVSWGWGGATETLLAIAFLEGESSRWESVATESIYGGSRVEAQGKTFGGWSDGSYGSAAAKWMKGWGAAYRLPYPECNVDLTRYDAGRAKQWGAYGNGGRDDQGRLDEQCKAHPVKSTALVKTWDEAVAALKNGYPIAVCSSIGFSNVRDSDGFARAGPTWHHCMYFNGYRGGKRPGLLCTNSWGKFNSGPKWPADQPDGSFWVDKSTVERMLAGNGYPDSFALSNHVGFPKRKLRHNEGWLWQTR